MVVFLGWGVPAPMYLIGTGELVLLGSVAAIYKVGGQDWCWGGWLSGRRTTPFFLRTKHQPLSQHQFTHCGNIFEVTK